LTNCELFLLQIKELWNDSVPHHHLTWKNKSLPWLWPNKEPLPHDFREEKIHEEHLKKLQHTHWSTEKVK